MKELGARVRFKVDFDIYPFVELVTCGAIGTVVEVSPEDHGYWISMDEPFKGYDKKIWMDNRWPMRGIWIDMFNDPEDDTVELVNSEKICQTCGRPTAEWAAR